MKKLLNCLLAMQLILLLTGCCALCPCAKKASEQNPAQETQPEPQEEHAAQ